VRINGVGANAPYEFGRSFLATNGDGALHLLYIIAPNVLHTQIVFRAYFNFCFFDKFREVNNSLGVPPSLPAGIMEINILKNNQYNLYFQI